VRDGPDRVCNTAKSGDDAQDRAVNNAQPNPLTGFDDWANIKFRAALSVDAGGADTGHGPDITFAEALANQTLLAAYLDPDLQVSVSRAPASVSPGESVVYTVTVRNVGTGPAKSVQLSNTLPSSSATSQSLPDLAAGAQVSRSFTYTVPCTATDGSSLVDSATASGTNAIGAAENNTTNNTGAASAVVTAPVLTLTKTVQSPALAGEASTTTLTYANTGTGTATSVVATDTLAKDVYYSAALDTGAGPKPTSVTPHADGTTTLSWTLGTVAAGGGGTIALTTRSSLLVTGGTALGDSAQVGWSSSGGCVYAPVTATGTTTLIEATPTRNPLSQGYWSTHPTTWTGEILARIQATDQRYDANGNGILIGSEVALAFSGSGQPATLRQQLLASYFNLASRRINASTAISSRTATAVGASTVGAAARYGIATLALPRVTATAGRYSDATTLLEEINTAKSERY
jgi:uncharacterized repeat protein (TIGR01451 family)